MTREDIVAEVYSELNGVLALGNNVSPLRPIAREAPAIAGDVQGNFQILNQDAQGIVQQLLDTEGSAAGLYNLFVSSQNNLRQMIREQLYQPSQRRYSEEFINSKRLDAQTSARIDYNAGVATAPLLKETARQPEHHHPRREFLPADLQQLGHGAVPGDRRAAGYGSVPRRTARRGHADFDQPPTLDGRRSL